MFTLSLASKRNLNTCNKAIQGAVLYLLHHMDVGVIEGHRGEDRQNLLYVKKKTKLKYPNSSHNGYPSDAVDLMVFVVGIGYIDEQTCPDKWRQYYGYIAGLLHGYCELNGYDFRWGGNWDSDADFSDQNFDDLVHFEIKEKK